MNKLSCGWVEKTNRCVRYDCHKAGPCDGFGHTFYRSNPSRIEPEGHSPRTEDATVTQPNGSGADQPEKHSRSSDGVVGDTIGDKNGS